MRFPAQSDLLIGFTIGNKIYDESRFHQDIFLSHDSGKYLTSCLQRSFILPVVCKVSFFIATLATSVIIKRVRILDRASICNLNK